MYICQNCGRQVEDGMVCGCMAQPQQPVQPQQPMMQMNQQATAAATNAYNNIYQIFVNPVQGIRNYVYGATWLWTGILVGISMVVSLIFKIINMIKYDQKFGDFMLYGVLKNTIIHTGLTIGALALFVYLFITLIARSTISWEKAFGVATITLLISIPVSIITNIWGYVDYSDNFFYTFFSWIIGTIREFRTIVALLLFFFATSSFVPDTKKALLTTVSAWSAYTFACYIINYVLDKIFH